MRAPALPFVLLATACGSSPRALPDGGTPDADPSTVTVITKRFDQDFFEAGIPVLFSNPDGSMAAQVVTNGNGRAAAPLPRGGAVTVVWAKPSWGLPQEPTVLETMPVQPGEVVDLTLRPPIPGACAPAAHAAVTVPVYAGAATYRLFDRVEELDLHGMMATTVTFLSCASGDVVAVAYDAGGAAIGWSEATFDFYQPPEIALPAFQPVSAYQVHLTGADLAGATLAVKRLPLSIGGALAPAPAATIDVSFPAIDAGWGTLHLVTTVTTATGVAQVSELIHPGDRSAAVDLAATLPSASVAATYADRTLHVTTTGTFPAKFLYAAWTGKTSIGGDLAWHVIAPPGTTAFVMPTLPSEFAAYDVTTTSAPTVALADGTDLVGWDKDHVQLAVNLFRILRGDASMQRTRVIRSP
jgi:hypothetical protein